jgi:hypothetical protein
MVEHGSLAMLGINHEMNPVVDLKTAFSDSASVHSELWSGPLGIKNLELISS